MTEPAPYLSGLVLTDRRVVVVGGGGVAQLTGEGDPGREEAPRPLRPCPVGGRGAPPRWSRVTV